MKITNAAWLLAGALLAVGPALAHHSYAMFDGTKRMTVAGTVAKLEWQNPHVFVWVYVPQAAGGHLLYGIESDSINALVRRGWSKTSLEPGDPVTVEFFALADGRPGGHLIRAVRADGSELEAQPGPLLAISSGVASGAPPAPPAGRAE